MSRAGDSTGGGWDEESSDAFLREVAGVDDERDVEYTVRTAGSRLGRFVVHDELGRGGMGIVYRAHDDALGRTVALKLLPSKWATEPHRRARFLREARSAGSVVHPNVATVYEVGESESSLYIAMELVAGENLRARFSARRPLPFHDVMRIAKGIARGLAAAHAKGVVHRDLKPENVVVGVDGEPKILDFGLAKLRDAQQTPRDILEQQPTDALSTEAGRLLGTPAYMSPEQAAGRPIDARSDLFSFGVVLYEALTGGRPFIGATSVETLASVIRDAPVPLCEANPDVPPELEAIVMCCLAKAAADRYPNADELLAALDGLVTVSLRPVAVSMQNASVLATPSIDRTRQDLDQTPPRSTRSRKRKFFGIGATAVCCIGALVSVAVVGRQARSPTLSAPPSSNALAESALQGPIAALPPTSPMLDNIVVVSIEVTPASAHVLLDGKSLDPPFIVKRAKEFGAHQLKIVATGYLSQERVILFDRDHIESVTLARATSPDPARAAPQLAPAPTTNPRPAADLDSVTPARSKRTIDEKDPY